MWGVRVWEPYPPKGAEAIQWCLLTNEPVDNLADALRVISWYQTRWVIEEFHKALKTSCKVEGLQFTDTERLEPMIALLSTVATTLLNLRAASQLADAHTRRAATLIDHEGGVSPVRRLRGFCGRGTARGVGSRHLNLTMRLQGACIDLLPNPAQ